MKQDTTSTILTYDGAAELLGLPKGTVYAMVSRKELPHFRLGARNVRFSSVALLEWLQSRHIQIATKATKRGGK